MSETGRVLMIAPKLSSAFIHTSQIPTLFGVLYRVEVEGTYGLDFFNLNHKDPAFIISTGLDIGVNSLYGTTDCLVSGGLFTVKVGLTSSFLKPIVVAILLGNIVGVECICILTLWWNWKRLFEVPVDVAICVDWTNSSWRFGVLNWVGRWLLGVNVETRGALGLPLLIWECCL